MIDFDNVEKLIFGQPEKQAPKGKIKADHKKPVKKGKRTIDLDAVERLIASDRVKN